jgi:anaerobic magnesium-protoporphyrin IX monomethyl ester cyclase
MARTDIPFPQIRARTGRRASSDVAYLLVNPPLTSPVNPYHSISYLVGATRAAGFTDYRCVDANVEALNYLARPDLIEPRLERARQECARLEAADVLSRADELRYQAALAAEGLSSDFMQQAIGIFRDPSLFYHYPTYRQAVMAVRRWLELLSLDGPPAVFDGLGLRMTGAANFSNLTDMTDESAIDLVTGPFRAYVEGPFRELLRQREWDLVGLSVNYHSQLPFALSLAREIKSSCPDAVVVVGGTEIGDEVKFSRSAADLWRLLRDADVIVPGEGETPLRAILTAVRDSAPLAGIPGILVPGDAQRIGAINYEDVAGLPAPAYDIWDWDAYWAPEPVVMYSPTRGCYWNRCTFCDYGLNSDRPTSPSRERSVETVRADLMSLASVSRTIYFAVDAMSPRYLRTLAGVLADLPHRVRWSAELRLERTFPKRDLAELLARSGCVSISFGYESGSQRVLDLIDKGVRIDTVPTILRDLAEHGIAAQMMGFTGFPSETAAEAEETYGFLVRHRELWSLAGIDTFLLTPGAIVARKPDAFGIELLDSPPCEDIPRFHPWRDQATGIDHWPGHAHPIPPGLRSAIVRCTDGQPFVGGIDSGHTLLYFARFGRELLPESKTEEPRLRIVQESTRTVPFADLGVFTSPRDLSDAYAGLQRHGDATQAALARWLAQPGAARPGRSTALIVPSGVGITLPGGVDAERMTSLVQLLAKVRGSA